MKNLNAQRRHRGGEAFARQHVPLRATGTATVAYSRRCAFWCQRVAGRLPCRPARGRFIHACCPHHRWSGRHAPSQHARHGNTENASGAATATPTGDSQTIALMLFWEVL